MKTETKSRLLNRLKRVEGRVRGLTRMVGEDRYCVGIARQNGAVCEARARIERISR